MKRSLSDMLRDVVEGTPEIRIAAQLEYQHSMKKMKADMGRVMADPNWRAMEKIEAAIKAMKLDPDIAVSEACVDFLDLMGDLLDGAWPHHSLARIVAPMQKHFDGVKSKDATEKLQEKRNIKRELHHSFLDQQDTADTVKLAARLRKKFGIEAVRGSEDTVRAWKKLRQPGKT